MSRQDWLDTRDAPLAAAAAVFSAGITAAPTSVGLTAPDATAFATLVTNYQDALDVVEDPATRTAVTIASKDTAKTVLIASFRSLAKRVQAFPGVSPEQKTALGLPVHSAVPTPVPPPSTQPILGILATGNRQHLIRLWDTLGTTSRAKPIGVSYAEIYAWPGENPPADLEDWNYKGAATKSEFVVNYVPEDAGKSVTLVARWANRKGQVGPVSDADHRDDRGVERQG